MSSPHHPVLFVADEVALRAANAGLYVVADHLEEVHYFSVAQDVLLEAVDVRLLLALDLLRWGQDARAVHPAFEF